MKGKFKYTSVCPLKLIPKIFLFDEEELKPEVRAQRVVNEKRVPVIARYIIENPKSYTFSAITVSVDGELEFEPISDTDNEDIGNLHISMDAKFLINDGQHRRAAIEEALKEEPDLGEETISVVIFPDQKLKKSQQMFADLNKYAVRPNKSIGILYDHRDVNSQISNELADSVPMFINFTEKEKSSLSNRSRKVFTLSGIHSATLKLLKNIDEDTEQKIALAKDFWSETSKHIKEWNLVKNDKLSSHELRKEYIVGHTLALSAIAIVGNSLLKNHKNWEKKLIKLKTLDWSRNNNKLWEGRALNAGRLSKKNVNVILTSNQIKHHLGVKLDDNEIKYENDFLKGKNEQIN